MLKAIKTLAILLVSAGVSFGQAFTFSDIPFLAQSPISGPLLWLKADAITGYTDGQSLSNWVDSGPFSMVVTQGVSSNRPIYITSGITGPITGPDGNVRPVVYFNSTNQLCFDLPTMFTSENQAELFIVLRLTNSPNLIGSGADAGSWTFAGTDPSAPVYDYSDGNTYDGFASTVRKTVGNFGFQSTSWHVWNTSSTNDSWTARTNFIQMFTTASNVFTNGAAGGSVTRRFGRSDSAAHWLNGMVAEVILYGRILGAAERGVVSNYLYTKYTPMPASPFFPTNVPGGFAEAIISAAAWYEPSRAAYVTNAGTAYLTNLTSVGSLFNLTNLAAVSPTLQSAQLNGLDAIGFDGTDDRLDCVSLVGPQPFEVFMVYAMTNVGARVIFGAMNTVNCSFDSLLTAGTMSIYAGGAGSLPVFAITNKYHVVDTIYAGPSSLIFTNGVLGNSGGVGVPGTTGFVGFKLGARNDNAIPGNFSMASLIVFTNRVLSPTQRSNVFFYCTNRFSPFP